MYKTFSHLGSSVTCQIYRCIPTDPPSTTDRAASGAVVIPRCLIKQGHAKHACWTTDDFMVEIKTISFYSCREFLGDDRHLLLVNPDVSIWWQVTTKLIFAGHPVLFSPSTWKLRLPILPLEFRTPREHVKVRMFLRYFTGKESRLKPGAAIQTGAVVEDDFSFATVGESLL